MKTSLTQKHLVRVKQASRIALRWLLAASFVFAGTLHLVAPGVYMRVMPPYLPFPDVLVLISGVCEIAGGVGILLPPVRRLAGWGLIALLIAVFPANVEIAQHGMTWGNSYIAPIWGWLRLPLQIPLIAWVYWCAVQTPVREPSA